MQRRYTQVLPENEKSITTNASGRIRSIPLQVSPSCDQTIEIYPYPMNDTLDFKKISSRPLQIVRFDRFDSDGT